jgi:hypothetical protein
LRTKINTGIFITVLACLFSACTGPGQPSLIPVTQLPQTAPEIVPTLQATDPLAPSATATDRAASSQQATPTSGMDLSSNTQYTLTAELDYALHELTVQEKIVFTNHTAEPIPELLLIVEPSRYPGLFNYRSWPEREAGCKLPPGYRSSACSSRSAALAWR